MKSKKSKIKTIQPLLVSLPETRPEKCSRAGQFGAASRWKDHEHIKSKLTRIYQDDFDFISEYCSNANIPFVVALHRLCAFVIHRHGYSAFMVGESILQSK